MTLSRTLLKSRARYFRWSLTCMVNASLSTGHFPDVWKEAIVNPLLKKGGKDTTHKNLRPVSNLQFVSKITERAVFDQVYNHVTVNELFPGFHRSWCTGNRIVRRLRWLRSSMTFCLTWIVTTCLCLYYLILAQPSIPLTIPSSFAALRRRLVLPGMYSSGSPLTYQVARPRVMVNGELSNKLRLSLGVPQRSCLGPLLFSVYACKLFGVIKCGSVAQWLGRLPWDPEIPGLRPALTARWTWEFSVVPGSTALVNSQLVCLRPVGILNSCCCYSVPSLCFIGPEMPLWGAVN